MTRDLKKDTDDFQAVKGIIWLKAVTKNESSKEALNDLNEQIKQHPKIASQLAGERVFIEDFDRHAYVFGLPVIKNLPMNKN